ncbi:MAG: hypothetical protein KJO07_08135, partial [Deltaproteobacteria bacterium]|nr:hypothetical protein [Deltaproteobacteria bacterium]
MWLLFKLAARSAFRHKWRSLLTGLAIALGLTLVLVFEGITSYGYTKRIHRHVRYGSGHVLVQPPGFLDRRTLDMVIPDPKEILAKAKSLPGIEHATVRVQGFGLLSSGPKSSSINLVGTIPAVEPTASTISSERKRVAGDYVRTRDQLP